MGQFTILGDATVCQHKPMSGKPVRTRAVLWLQGITLAWMLIECGVSLYSAITARSVVLLAFGSDSFVELLSASVVLLAVLPQFKLSQERANRWAGFLLFALAAIVALIAIASLALRTAPETSRSGIAITIASLLVMPLLAYGKRRVAKATSNRALAADAVQSATCAWLATITLIGLAAHALFHIDWIDAAAALAAIPILVLEGRRSLRGESCGCC